jgi:hypothetical protein
VPSVRPTLWLPHFIACRERCEFFAVEHDSRTLTVSVGVTSTFVEVSCLASGNKCNKCRIQYPDIRKESAFDAIRRSGALVQSRTVRPGKNTVDCSGRFIGP